MTVSVGSYSPKFEGEIVSWAERVAQYQAPKMSITMDADDVFQEIYLKFVKLVETKTFDNEKHFIGTFKVSVTNMLTTYKTHYHSRAKDPEPFNTVHSGRDAKASGGCTQTDGCMILHTRDKESDPQAANELRDLFENLPGIFKKIVKFRDKTSLTIEATQKRFSYRSREDGLRETHNEKLCRLAGVDPKENNLLKILHDYLDDSR